MVYRRRLHCRMLHRQLLYCRMLYLIPIICLGLVFILIFVIYGQPRWVIYFLAKYNPDVLFYVDLPSNLRYISLTIDDFPNANDLSISFHLLDILRQYNAKCTFFLIGSHVKKYADTSGIRTLFKRLIADGHEIGNHGWIDEQAIRLSEEELKQQIIDTENIIFNYTNSFNKKWFRPGSGFFNQTMIQLCKSLGYRLVLGSVYPYDPQLPHPRLNSHFIGHKLHAGAIVILHDRFVTIETLQRVLPDIQRQNFHVLTLTQLMSFKNETDTID